MKNEPIVIEDKYKVAPEKVWKAITDKNEMRKWYFNLAEFKPELGFEFSFYGGPDGRQYQHLCRITEVVPGNKISHTWRYEGYSGNSQVTFELFPEGDFTVLRLTHEDLDTFPDDNPDFARKNFVEGWNHIIRSSLREYLEQ
jgi:uncharacterized protein YndB with AHSA1/START domain